MDPLVIAAPLSVALHVVQQMLGGSGWYDTSDLWRPFEPLHGQRTSLSASATPFMPTTPRKADMNDEDDGCMPNPADEEVKVSIPVEPKMPPSAYQMFIQKSTPAMTGSATKPAKELSKLWRDVEPSQNTY